MLAASWRCSRRQCSDAANHAALPGPGCQKLNTPPPPLSIHSFVLHAHCVSNALMKISSACFSLCRASSGSPPCFPPVSHDPVLSNVKPASLHRPALVHSLPLPGLFLLHHSPCSSVLPQPFISALRRPRPMYNTTPTPAKNVYNMHTQSAWPPFLASPSCFLSSGYFFGTNILTRLVRIHPQCPLHAPPTPSTPSWLLFCLLTQRSTRPIFKLCARPQHMSPRHTYPSSACICIC